MFTLTLQEEEGGALYIDQWVKRTYKNTRAEGDIIRYTSCDLRVVILTYKLRVAFGELLHNITIYALKITYLRNDI